MDALALGTTIKSLEAKNMFSSKPTINGSLKVKTRDFLPLLKVSQHFDDQISEEFVNLGIAALSFATSLETLPKNMIVLDELQLDLLGLKLSSNLQIT